MVDNGRVLDAARILAALEHVPAEWRDLSELISSMRSTSPLTGGSAPQLRPIDQELLRYLQGQITSQRIAFWTENVRLLLSKHQETSLLVAFGADYPRNLGECFDRPPLLFVQASDELDWDRAVAVVGSRKTSPRNLEVARQLATTLAENGVTVVSGLAPGVDSYAHKASIDAGGRTVAVLASGLGAALTDPPRSELASAIQQHGAIVSPYPPFAPATASSFVARNAVISGLSRASVLIDVREASGSHSEAEASLRQGRDILLWEPALPPSEWSKRFALSPHVHLVSSTDDVIQTLSNVGLVLC